LDIIIHDEPMFVVGQIRVRWLGVAKAEPAENRKTVHHDRIVGALTDEETPEEFLRRIEA
jgi:hypothetical protein